MAFALDLSDSLLLFRVRCAPESKDPLPGVSGFYILGEGKPLFYRKKVGDRSRNTQN